MSRRFRSLTFSTACVLLCSGLTTAAAASAASAATNQITVTAPSTEQSTVGTAVRVPVSATDSDSSAALTYSAGSLPGGLSIDPSTGVISGTPAGLASDTVTVTVTDGTGSSGTASIAWQVGGNITVNVPAGGFGGFMGQTVEWPFTVTDNAPGDALTWNNSQLILGLHVDPADSRIVGWPVRNTLRWGSLTANGLDGGTGSETLGFTPLSGVAGATGPARLDVGGKCLDDKGDSSAVGAVVDAWNCNGTAAQKWTYYSDGTIRINGLCLNVKPTTTTYSYMDLATCAIDNSYASQQWNINTGGQLRNLQPNGTAGFCLADPNPGTTNGTQLMASACSNGTGNPQSEWTLPAQTVHSAIAGRCLDDYQTKTANGTPVDAYSCNGHANQNWTFEPDGTIRVNGKCLDDTGNSSAAGTKLQLWNCNGGAAQQWTVSGADNSFGLDLRHGSLCATPTAFTAANGAQLVLGACGTDQSYWHAW